MSDKVNNLELETRLYKVKPLRFTSAGKAVCSARTSLSTQLDNEWQSVWFEVTAWEDAARVLAECQHGEDVILRGARLSANAFRTKDGEVVVQPKITANVVERLGVKPKASAPQPMSDSVPF